MNAETLEKLALEEAALNGGVLSRLSNGRWQGKEKRIQLPTETIRDLLKQGKLKEVERSAPSENKETRNTGIITKVSLA